MSTGLSVSSHVGKRGFASCSDGAPPSSGKTGLSDSVAHSCSDGVVKHPHRDRKNDREHDQAQDGLALRFLFQRSDDARVHGSPSLKKSSLDATAARAAGDDWYFQAMSEAVQNGLVCGLLIAVAVAGLLLLSLRWEVVLLSLRFAA